MTEAEERKNVEKGRWGMRKETKAAVMSVLALIVVTAMVVGCSSVHQTVRVFADPPDMEQLRGEWYGEYSSKMTGRNGTIFFTLNAAKDSAYGSVVMIAMQFDTPGQPVDHDQAPSVRWKALQSLTISFVAVEGGYVRGTLDPYIDPNCNCTVTTTFDGRLESDTITGTYTSTGIPLGLPTSGVWKAVRKKDKPNI